MKPEARPSETRRSPDDVRATFFSYAGNWFGWSITAIVLVLIVLTFYPSGQTKEKTSG